MTSITKKFKDTKLKSQEAAATPLTDHPANLTQYQDGEFKNFPIDVISPDPDQPRQFFDELALNELAESIKQKGVLQPVIVRIDENQKVWLVAGERRYRAARIAGLSSVPGIITKGHPAEIALIENIQREDLKPMEEAEAYARMVNEHGYSQDQLAQVIGKAKSTISETMSLNKLPDDIKSEVRRADLPRRLLLEVSKQKTDAQMRKLYKRIVEKNLSSDQVREISRQPREPKRRTPAEIVIERLSYLNATLSAFNLDTAKDEERLQFLTLLRNLKEQIDQFLE